MKRDFKTPRTTTALEGAHVPMCHTCNSRLDRTIEKPVRPIVRRLLHWRDPHAGPILTKGECETLARWILKVGLLKSHPKAVHDHPKVNSDPDVPRFSKVLPEWLSWMRSGSAPPDGFSVYITRRSTTGDATSPNEQYCIILPRVIVDGTDLRFMAKRFGFQGFDAILAWHPGWPIVNPLVEDGRAIQLWPNPSLADFAQLPEVHPNEFTLWDGSIGALHFTEADYLHATQNPLSVTSDPFNAFF